MADVGDLVRCTDGRLMVRPPRHCPNGHQLGQLGPGRVLVGHVACLGHGGGHTTWRCCTCDQVVYGPALNTHRTALSEPAQIRTI